MVLNKIKRGCFWILKCCYFIKQVLWTKKPNPSYLTTLQTFDGNTCSESVGHLGSGEGI